MVPYDMRQEGATASQPPAVLKPLPGTVPTRLGQKCLPMPRTQDRGVGWVRAAVLGRFQRAWGQAPSSCSRMSTEWTCRFARLPLLGSLQGGQPPWVPYTWPTVTHLHDKASRRLLLRPQKFRIGD